MFACARRCRQPIACECATKEQMCIMLRALLKASFRAGPEVLDARSHNTIRVWLAVPCRRVRT